MASNNDNQPVTVGILNTTLKKALKENNVELREEIKKDTLHLLGEFTEEVLLPAVDKIVDDKIGTAKIELKDYTHREITKLRGDLVVIVRGDKDRDQTFKTKVVEIFDRNKLAQPDELIILSELAR